MKDDLHQLSTSLESVGKLIAVNFGLLYLTGFLIVTFHLSRYGILTLSLVRTQYVITGLYFFVPSAGILFTVIAALRKIASKKERLLNALKSRKAPLVIAEIFFGFIDIVPLGVYVLLCLGILLDFFSIRPVPVSGWTVVRLVAVIMLFGGFIHGTIDELVLFIKSPLDYFSARKLFDDVVPSRPIRIVVRNAMSSPSGPPAWSRPYLRMTVAPGSLRIVNFLSATFAQASCASC